MKNSKLTFKNFELEQISRKQQMIIRGGNPQTPPDPNEPVDPSKVGGAGNP